MPRAWRRWHQNGLAAVTIRERRDELGTLQRRGVQTDLVGPRVNRRRGILFGPNTTANSERNEELSRDRANRVGERTTPLDRRRDVENHELVDAFAVISSRELGRIAGATQPFEVDPFDDLPIADVKTGDDAFGQHPAP